MISNRLAMLGTRNIVYTLYELQLQANNEFITAHNCSIIHVSLNILAEKAQQKGFLKEM